jgi:RNase P subunit RPR2
MKCSACGFWNRFEVKKALFEPNSPEPTVKVFIPMYMALKLENCKKCGKLVTQTNELIRITQGKEGRTLTPNP